MKLTEIEIPGPRQDYIGYGKEGFAARWPNDARVVVNIAVNYEEGSEQMKSLGDTENESFVEFTPLMPHDRRDLAVESVFEYGSRVGIWRLQRLFDDLKVPFTLFGCAIAIERNPEVGDWIKESGNDVCAHGWRWEKVWRLSREEEKQHMEWAVRSIEQTCGSAPQGWYCRYGPSEHTRELVVEHGGFLYDSDAYNDELPYYTNVKGRKHLVVPYSQTLNDGKFVRPQGYGSATDFLDSLKRSLDYLWEEGDTHPKMMSIGLHPRIIGQPYRMSALREFIEYAKEKEKVWFARRVDIAEHWLKNY
ncbi:polysaccharide deacetylase family protein [Sporosarcina sp. ACRSM]|uniref:polysaccharide deacetylase family protein n=1 Tax=Sporosarcina sp. ACRSM TaxID=2918216 RepID=UPI001EF4ADE8|nr:polysaccharide deacetylase family protein [Sporosarcina sp. ACRSM]MCG7336581.1 polysaccharide deacetylase family protein [Sporosarcina sp. ACRSM]